MVSATQVLFIAGITNLIFLVLVALTCRCITGFKFGIKWLQKSKFKKLYDWHCYYWIGFFVSVIIHTFLAFYLFGWPS
jgi:hypothetical protein